MHTNSIGALLKHRFQGHRLLPRDSESVGFWTCIFNKLQGDADAIDLWTTLSSTAHTASPVGSSTRSGGPKLWTQGAALFEKDCPLSPWDGFGVKTSHSNYFVSMFHTYSSFRYLQVFSKPFSSGSNYINRLLAQGTAGPLST